MESNQPLLAVLPTLNIIATDNLTIDIPEDIPEDIPSSASESLNLGLTIDMSNINNLLSPPTCNTPLSRLTPKTVEKNSHLVYSSYSVPVSPMSIKVNRTTASAPVSPMTPNRIIAKFDACSTISLPVTPLIESMPNTPLPHNEKPTSNNLCSYRRTDSYEKNDTIGIIHNIDQKTALKILRILFTLTTTILSIYILFAAVPLTTVTIVLLLCIANKAFSITEITYYRYVLHEDVSWYKTKIFLHIFSLAFIFAPFFNLFFATNDVGGLLDTIANLFSIQAKTINDIISAAKIAFGLCYSMLEMLLLMTNIRCMVIKKHNTNEDAFMAVNSINWLRHCLCCCLCCC